MSSRQIRAGDVLRDMARTFDERNAMYGDNWRNVGDVMVALFPNGVQLRSADDFIRFHLFDWTVGKLTRFANTGMTDVDSAHDGSVYLAMIEAFMQSVMEEGEEDVNEV